MVEQQVSTDRRPVPVAAYTTTDSGGSNTATPPITVTATGWPVCGSVEVIAASRPRIAGIPRASRAHIAYTRTPPTSTT